ncbi:MAG TPA: hypothetical protein VJU86_04960 [Pyrinomonadaceae bacterium]|nr:hypothetical protein [Pyrinomonadaceae bacterium]
MMTKDSITRLFCGFVFLLGTALVIQAQVPATGSTDATEQTAQQKEEKEAAEKKATDLLEQIVGQVQLLKLPENRIRVEIAAGNLLWKRNEGRARSLLMLAGEGVAEMNRGADGNVQRRAAQLRQELILTVAQHDAALAYQLLATTKPLTPADSANDSRRFSPDANLEENLLARVAVIDPKLAAQKVEEELTKGQYPNTLAQVLSRLRSQDKEAAAKLSAKVVSKLQTENILANVQAQALAVNLLRGGPVAAQAVANPTATQTTTAMSGSAGVLSESSFQELLNTVIDAALRATPQPATNQGVANNSGGRNNGRGRGNFGAAQNATQTPLSEGQLAQQNARRLLARVQVILPQVDQYLPSRATAVRNKLTELGMASTQRMPLTQMNTLMREGTTDSLLAAAPEAPTALQSRIYQQAAQKALDEGNPERARQIANDHLDAASRERVLQKVDFQLIAKKIEANNLDEMRQQLATLPSDDERIDFLLQLAAQAQWATGDQQPALVAKGDKKLALQFLTEAQRLSMRRASNYQQFDQQLRVASALAEVDPARSFDMLDPGISQLNELLSAAAVLSGFEVNIFRDGELPLEASSGLGSMITRYGQVLATLAKTDFARAESSANKFQLAEARVLSQLAIVRNVLGVPQTVPIRSNFNGRGEGRRRAF